jgi:hypothetical protein
MVAPPLAALLADSALYALRYPDPRRVWAHFVDALGEDGIFDGCPGAFLETRFQHFLPAVQTLKFAALPLKEVFGYATPVFWADNRDGFAQAGVLILGPPVTSFQRPNQTPYIPYCPNSCAQTCVRGRGR